MAGDPRTRLLSQAEKLFADAGTEGVSLRGVARAAGVSPALVHYHFGSREALVEAVVLRRLGPIQKRRVAMLEALRERSEAPGVREVLEVLVVPVAEVAARRGRAGRAYLKLLSRLLSDHRGFTVELVMAHFGEPLRAVGDLLAAALPGLSRELIGRRLTLGVQLSLATLADPQPFAAAGDEPPADAHELAELLLDFLTGALAAPDSRDAARLEPAPEHARPAPAGAIA